MAEAILDIAIGKLSSIVEKELSLFLGFEGDLERLSSLFTTIKATLRVAEEKQFSDEAIKDWLVKLKRAAYELDDILDECAYEALGLEYQGGGERVKVNMCGLSDKVQCSFLPSFHPKHALFRYKIAKRMKGISERLDQIAGERTKFHLSHLTETTVPERRSTGVTQRRRQQTTSFIAAPQVRGREADTKKIVDFLVADADASHSQDLLVYPIVGLGGLGKTTLAQLIFNHERIVNHFEPRIWVCVSEDFSLERMTKAIIETESGRACEDLDLDPLQRKLRDLLQSKRYLLVLDDVWDDNQENWQQLRSVLACGAKGASILVTTRLSKVAEIMGTLKHPHELSMLPDEDCWELFKERAFGSNEVEMGEFEDIGKEIVNKCQGVPLAAKALGGVLRSKKKKSEWLNVKESNFLKLSHDENSIMPVLRLSYLNLSIELRQCFAYCAIFPKDKEIKKQRLIELWMANGFISSEGMLDAEDVGDSVWHELCWRSFFQDIKTDEFGKVRSFKMHDLVHDLAQFVAEEVRCITNDNDNDVITLSEGIYHLSDCRWKRKSREEINSIKLHQVKSLRTYMGSQVHNTGQTELQCLSLRVLWCESREELSSSIGDLKHLRYLNLSHGSFKTLPESLCKLWNLQILKLDYCRSLQKLPNSLTRLKALRQLSLKDCYKLSSLPPHIGKLTSLKILNKYFVGNERGFHLTELGPLKLRGDLVIMQMEKVKSVKDAKEANMSSKQLNELGLLWDTNKEFELQENVEEILEVLQPDTEQLRSLTVKGYKGGHFPQWMFSPSLKRLMIDGCREVKGLHETLQHMTVLKELYLMDLPNLESLPDCFGSLPMLWGLRIYKCAKLTYLPTSLSLTSLTILEIHCCPELQKRCQREKGEDWPKIAHIRDIRM